MANFKTNKNTIRAKAEAIKRDNDNPETVTDHFLSTFRDDLPSVDGTLRKRLDDYSDKLRSKKNNTNDIFSELVDTVDMFLVEDGNTPNDLKEKSKNKNKLRKYAQESARTSLQASKQIMMNSVRNTMFSGEGVCGSNSPIPYNDLQISPKEFDLLNMLTISPESTTGTILYSSKEDKGFIKMNREFYKAFDSNVPYVFKNNDNSVLFNIQWDKSVQKYSVWGLKGEGGITNVHDFLTDYYSSIEFPDLESVIKTAILLTIQGNGSESKTFNIGIDRLERLLQKLFSICGTPKTKKPLDEDSTNEVNENDEDIESYFDFNNVEGINLDDEDARHRRVLKFTDCNNFEVPVNPNHIDDFAYFVEKKEDINKNVSDTINKIAVEANEQSDNSISLENLQITLTGLYILKLPKALISAILSPKMIFPIVVVYKLFKGIELSVTDVMKILSKVFYEIVKKVFWKFIREFWKFVKKDLLIFVKKLAVKIIKNKLKRWKTILSSLIALLTKLLNVEIASCDEILNAILSTIENALNTKINIPVPGLLLSMADNLSGYSTDRSRLNIVERLSNAGIPMEPLYGRPNKLSLLVKSIIDGHMEEIDKYSYVKIAMKPSVIPVAPLGGTGSLSFINTGVGKLF